MPVKKACGTLKKFGAVRGCRSEWKTMIFFAIYAKVISLSISTHYTGHKPAVHNEMAEFTNTHDIFFGCRRHFGQVEIAGGQTSFHRLCEGSVHAHGLDANGSAWSCVFHVADPCRPIACFFGDLK